MAELPGEPPIEPTRKDLAKRVGYGFLSDLVPVGSALAAILRTTYPETLEKRRDEFLRRVSENIEENRERITDLEGRVGSDEFVTLFREAGGIAINTHQPMVKEAAGNILVNWLLDEPGVGSWYPFYFNWLGSLRDEHLALLELARDPTMPNDGRFNSPDNNKDHMPALDLIKEQIEAWDWSEDFVKVIGEQLVQVGLVERLDDAGTGFKKFNYIQNLRLTDPGGVAFRQKIKLTDPTPQLEGGFGTGEN